MMMSGGEIMIEYTHYDLESNEKDLIIKAIEIAKLKLSVSTTGVVLEDM